jgi:hypothetical protein
MTAKLTDKQRRAMEHMERARNDGMALGDYARAYGVSACEIYDAMAALSRKGGVLPPATPSSKSSFVAMRVTPRKSALAPVPSAVRSAMICHVLIAGAVVIACAEWPAVAWLSALTGRPGAAA